MVQVTVILLTVTVIFGHQAELKYRQQKKEKKAEEMEAVNNIKLVRSLYGSAHCLKMEVIKPIYGSPSINASRRW